MFTREESENDLGFTLIETIVALGLGVMVLGMIMAVVVPGLKNINSITRTEHLHVNAVYTVDTLSYWIKQAESLSVPSASELHIKLNETTTKIIKKDGDNITLDGAVLNSKDINITSLNFVKLVRSVKIDIALKAKDGNETVPISTTIAQRNK